MNEPNIDNLDLKTAQKYTDELRKYMDMKSIKTLCDGIPQCETPAELAEFINLAEVTNFLQAMNYIAKHGGAAVVDFKEFQKFRDALAGFAMHASLFKPDEVKQALNEFSFPEY